MRASNGRSPIRRTLRMSGIAVLATLTVALTACGNSPDKSQSSTTEGGSSSGSQVAVTAPGVTDTEIRVGGVASTTNPLGGLEGDAFNGVQAYFDMINADGGIYGRKLVLAAQRDDKLGQQRPRCRACSPRTTCSRCCRSPRCCSPAPTCSCRRTCRPSAGPSTPSGPARRRSPGPTCSARPAPTSCFTCASPVVPWLVHQAGKPQGRPARLLRAAVGRLRRRRRQQLREVRVDRPMARSPSSTSRWPSARPTCRCRCRR